MISLIGTSYAALSMTLGGTQGTGDGEFDQPWGLAVNSTGWIHVIEYYNQRVSLFDNSTDHSFSSILIETGVRYNECDSRGGGTDCSANGLLNGPHDGTFDSSGNIWIVDTSNNRIQKFDPSGNYVTKFGSSGTGNGEFYSPKAIAIDSSDNIWIADTNNNRIQKFNSAGVYQSQFGSEGCQVIQNDGTIGEDPDGDGVYTKTERHNGKFCSPQDLDFDSDDNIFVVDHNNRRVQKFDSSGTYVTSFGSYGTTDGKFINPHYITIDPFNHIYVGDRERNNIQVFDENFNFRYSITGLSDPKDINLDNTNRLAVAYNHAVNLYTSSNSTLSSTTTSLDFVDYYDTVIESFSGTQLSSITIPSSNTAAALNFTRALNTSSASATDRSITFPIELTMNATTPNGVVDVTIPAGTSMNGTSWTGMMKLANDAGVTSITSINGTSQTVTSSQRFGDDDLELKFSNPIRIKFVGKGGQNFGYLTTSGATNSTSTTCVSDNLSAVTSQLGGSGECYLTVGSDLITYTNHFTTFFTSTDVTTSTETSSSSSGSTGSGSCNSKGFGIGKSLAVYEVSYDMCGDNKVVDILAYSTCGSIRAELTTEYGRSAAGLSLEQPFIEDDVTVYTGVLRGDIKSFTIKMENKRNEFEEKFVINECKATKRYSLSTGYTSSQQGSFGMDGLTASVPDWVKNTAGWWADDKISENEFVKGIEFLIKERIIDTVQTSTTESTSSAVPLWVKNTAGWWADDKISEGEFVKGIEYLIKGGLIQID